MFITAEDICENYRALTGARSCVLVRANDPREAFELLGDGAAGGLQPQFVSAVELDELRVADIRSLAREACEQGECLVVDNSVPTAFGCNPLACGAVVSFECLGGGVAAVAVAKPRSKRACADDPAVRAHVFLQEAGLQISLSANEAAALKQHLETLPERIQRRFDHARALAEYLAANEHVTRVSYLGLEDHPDHRVAASVLLHGFGAYLEFEPRTHTDMRALAVAFSPEEGDSTKTRLEIIERNRAHIARLQAGEDSPLGVIDRLDPILRA